MSFQNEHVRFSNRTSFSAECRENTKIIVKNPQKPIDIELHIERERVFKILSEAIDYLQLSLSLPMLIENEELLKVYLNDEQFERVSFACKKYTSSDKIYLYGDHFHTPAIIPQKKKRPDAEPELRYDVNLAEVLDLLLKQLPPSVRNKYFELAIMEKPAELFMTKFQELIKIFKEKLFMSAQAEKEYVTMLRNVWRDNEKIKADIEETSKIYNNKKEIYEKEYARRKSILESKEAQILAFRNNCVDNIHKKIADSEKKMAIDWQDNEIQRVELEASVKASSQEYSQLLTNNLKVEKLLRAKCFKVETQLLSWLQKYDTDVTELNNQYEEVLNDYENDYNRLCELRKLYEEQHTDYVVVMAEKAAYEKDIFDKKCLLMRHTNATKKYRNGGEHI